MAQIPMMVDEKKAQPNPKVFVSKCCDAPTGVLLKINGMWWLLRDNMTASGQLATRAFNIAICRGCYKPLNDETPKEGWPFGVDEQIDEHCRQIFRESSK